MDILVVGGGGREHAIVMKLAESPKVGKLYCTPGNGGISRYAECFDVAATDIEGVVALAKKLKVDMVAVAPDDPLVLGMVDALQAEGFKTFGPKKNAAIIEGSKVFSKDLMKKYNIDAAHVVRHWDVCSKSCPGWTGWGANGCDASIWNQFKKDIVSANSRKGVGTVRKLTPGKAFLYCDAPIYKRDWKTVIINGHKGDEVTIMDSGTGGVKVKYNDTIGYMKCEYLMPYISTGDLLEAVEDFTVTIRKGTVLRAADNGYLGSRVTIHNGNVSIDDRYVQKVKK